jgi:hypothetical protein
VLENLKPSAVNMPSVLQDYKAGEVIRKAADKIDVMTYAQTVKQTKTDKWHENLFTPGRVEDVKVTVAHAFSVPDIDRPSQTATTTLFDHEGGVCAATDDTLAPHHPIIYIVRVVVACKPQLCPTLVAESRISIVRNMQCDAQVIESYEPDPDTGGLTITLPVKKWLELAGVSDLARVAPTLSAAELHGIACG